MTTKREETLDAKLEQQSLDQAARWQEHLHDRATEMGQKQARQMERLKKKRVQDIAKVRMPKLSCRPYLCSVIQT